MQIMTFSNPEFSPVRTMTINNEPYFVGRDVATILGYSNTSDALAKHVDEEDKGVAKCDTPGGTQDMIVINESGLYSLILSSKLQSAKKFKRWITSEVLPAIRKTGGYSLARDQQFKESVLSCLKALNDRQSELSLYLKQQQRLNAVNDDLIDRVNALGAIADKQSDVIKDVAEAQRFISSKINKDHLPLPSFKDEPLTIVQTAKEFGVDKDVFCQWLLNNKWFRRDAYGNLYPDENLMKVKSFAVAEYKSPKMKAPAYSTKITLTGQKQLWHYLMREEDFFKNIRCNEPPKQKKNSNTREVIKSMLRTRDIDTTSLAEQVSDTCGISFNGAYSALQRMVYNGEIIVKKKHRRIHGGTIPSVVGLP